VPFKTPPIPQWIRTLSTCGYSNIYSYGLGNTNLFGTETLLGDWDGPVLVVAKDFAPAKEVESLIRRGTDPTLVYRHNDGDGRYRTGRRTNTRLLRFMYGADGKSMFDGSCNTECGALFVSACFFLKPGDQASSPLNSWGPKGDVFVKSLQVLEFVIENMPKLRAIACLGSDARPLVRSSKIPDRVTIHDHLHPAFGSNLEHEQNWRRAYRESGVTRNGTRLS
jgi:hypothetical protein